MNLKFCENEPKRRLWNSNELLKVNSVKSETYQCLISVYSIEYKSLRLHTYLKKSFEFIWISDFSLSWFFTAYIYYCLISVYSIEHISLRLHMYIFQKSFEFIWIYDFGLPWFFTVYIYIIRKNFVKYIKIIMRYQKLFCSTVLCSNLTQCFASVLRCEEKYRR